MMPPPNHLPEKRTSSFCILFLSFPLLPTYYLYWETSLPGLKMRFLLPNSATPALPAQAYTSLPTTTT